MNFKFLHRIQFVIWTHNPNCTSFFLNKKRLLAVSWLLNNNNNNNTYVLADMFNMLLSVLVFLVFPRLRKRNFISGIVNKNLPWLRKHTSTWINKVRISNSAVSLNYNKNGFVLHALCFWMQEESFIYILEFFFNIKACFFFFELFNRKVFECLSWWKRKGIKKAVGGEKHKIRDWRPGGGEQKE